MSEDKQIYYTVAGKKIWVTETGLSTAEGILGVRPEYMPNYIINEVFPWGLSLKNKGKEEFTEDLWPEAVGWMREILKRRYDIEIEDETDMISTFISIMLGELEDCRLHGY